MTWNFDDLNVGGQLQIGAGVPPAVGQGDKRINGSAYAEGPVVIGGPTEFVENEATLMVARTKNDDDDCTPANRSLYVKGNVRIDGDSGTGSSFNIEGGPSTAIDINGKTTIDNAGDAIFAIGTGGQTLSARFSSADARPKPFDIQHPSKGKGWRLRYACIEGPEVGVYCRGRVKNEKIIRLPAVWKDLVHINSISVQLQPIGAHQDVIVKRWDDEFIHLQGKGIPIDCFYHVYAERKDINPLITEYEGDSCSDYPDPNHHTIPEQDRNYNDPQYRGDRNTITG